MNTTVRGIIMFLATGALCGYAPVMPGTVGSAAGMGCFAVLSSLSLPAYGAVTAAVIFSSFRIADKASRIFKNPDPPQVVIDEIAGTLVTMLSFPADWKYMAAGFVLFRIMDIVKPYPANWINDNMPGGYGIVLDDIVAGIYANLALQLIRLAV